MTELAAIKKCALQLLARREHSQRELQMKLQLRHFEQAQIATVLQYLQESDLQSDARFAESYTQMRINKGYGPLRIANELQERGVAAELIADYTLKTDEFWAQQAEKIFKKKFSRQGKDFNERAKQMRFMQYRGFMLEHIRSVVPAREWPGSSAKDGNDREPH